MTIWAISIHFWRFFFFFGHKNGGQCNSLFHTLGGATAPHNSMDEEKKLCRRSFCFIVWKKILNRALLTAEKKMKWQIKGGAEIFTISLRVNKLTKPNECHPIIKSSILRNLGHAKILPQSSLWLKKSICNNLKLSNMFYKNSSSLKGKNIFHFKKDAKVLYSYSSTWW